MELMVLSTLIAVFVLSRVVERVRLDRNLRQIKIRIHVNGSRGKSSVTRLIAAALRAGGIQTIAKTTGTTPRIIDQEGNETPLYRLGRANIKEQFHVLNLAGRAGTEAIVLECMALQPQLQSISEHRILRSTIGVITNCREDHLDIMGPGAEDVSKALAGTVPRRGRLVTAEERHRPILEHACAQRGTTLHAVSTSNGSTISDDEMVRFPYYEHRENVAVALEVAKICGVDRKTAFNGMINVRPDDGALQIFRVPFFHREILFVHGFAANDPESSLRIWELSVRAFPEVTRRIMVLNLRSDRPDRSRQLGAAIPTWTPKPDHMVLTGSGIQMAARQAIQAGYQPGSLTFAEDESAREVFEKIVSTVEKTALVVGLGNVAEPGLSLVTLFRNRGEPVPLTRFYPGAKTQPSSSHQEVHG